jgi:hypothetical protein
MQEEEVNILLKAKFIQETKKSIWIVTLLVPKKKNTDVICMCVDYTALNKHCVKDHFLFPHIDQIVDPTSGYERIKEKNAFIKICGIFCYTTMPFVLKNACATYQRGMQACLKEKIGRNAHVYVGDVIITTKYGS